MASIREKGTRKDGRMAYEIRSVNKSGEYISKSWVAPAGWAKKSIDRELAKVAAEFDRQVVSGEILSKKDRERIKKAEEEAAAQIKTVRQYGECIYIPAKRHECKIRTIEYYESMLANYIYPIIGEKKMVDVKPVDVRRVILSAQERKLGYSTIHGIYLTLAQFFKMATMEDAIDRNPMDKVEAPKRRKDELKHEIEAFTSEEIAHIRECFRKEPLKWRTFYMFMMDTGARKGEVCAIKWKNINFENGSVLIDSNIINVQRPGEGEERIQETTPKSGKARYVYPSEETMHLLREMQLQSGRFEHVFSQRGNDNRLNGKPLRPDSADQYLRKFAKKYGIEEKCNPHKFRHTFATLAIANGANIPAVSRALGHAQISTTMNYYVHPDEDAAKEASRILQKAIGQL